MPNRVKWICPRCLKEVKDNEAYIEEDGERIHLYCSLDLDEEV